MSFTTIYRAGVMIATGVIVVKGWQLYGPTNEQVKTFAVEAFDVAQKAWNKSQQSDPGSVPADPRLGVMNVPSTAPTVAVTTPPDNLSGAPIAAAPPLATPELSATAPTPQAAEDRLPALLAHLEKIGAADGQLTPWGAGGDMYRYCCRAKLSDSSLVARHFEAVAPEPAAAVEQVVAKLEAWRTASNDSRMLR